MKRPGLLVKYRFLCLPDPHPQSQTVPEHEVLCPSLLSEYGVTGLGFKGNSQGAGLACGSQRLPHQLELASAAEGFPDPGVSPECAQGWNVELEGGRLHRQPCLVLEGHQKHPVLLVLRVLPGNAELVPSVYKHPRALEEERTEGLTVL